MKGLSLLIASAALTALAATPAARADDELEVTLEVLDDLSDLEGGIIEMPGPGDELANGAFEADDGDDADGDFDEDGDEMTEEDGRIAIYGDEIDDSEFAGIEDDFEHDDVDTDIQDDLDDEDDFEEEEDVFDDDFDDEDEDSDLDDMDDDSDDV